MNDYDELSFHPTMDPHSFEVRKGGKRFANVMWHSDRAPRVEFSTRDNPCFNVTIDDMQNIIRKYEKTRAEQTKTL